MIASQFRSVRDVVPQPFATDWQHLVALLAHHTERTAKADGSLWSPCTYLPGARRGIAGVDQVHAFVADLDGESLDGALPRLDGLEWIAATTWSHRDDDPHWHLVVRLDRSIDCNDWRAVWSAVHRRLGVVGDPQTCDASRMFYLPQHAPGAPHQVRVGAGDALRVDALGVAGVSVPRRRGSQRRKRGAQPDFLSESWWREPCDLSRFDGMTKQQIAQALLDEFEALRAQLRLIRDDIDDSDG